MFRLNLSVSSEAALLIQFISERFDVNNGREGLIRLSPFFFYASFSFADYTLLLRFLVYRIVPYATDSCKSSLSSYEL